jgi:hypothetical protein
MSRQRLDALASATSAEMLQGVPRVRVESDRQLVRERGVFNGTHQKTRVLTKIPGYQLRWFNDEPGRIDTAIQRGGWEFVTETEVAQSDTNRVLQNNSDPGTRVRMISGKTNENAPLYSYLLKIKQEWYDEDQMDLIDRNRSQEQEMIRNGGLNTDRVGEKYLPDNRKVALRMKQDTFEKGSIN